MILNQDDKDLQLLNYHKYRQQVYMYFSTRLRKHVTDVMNYPVSLFKGS